MLNSPETAKRFLEDPSWKKRLAAISILRERWGSKENVASLFEKMAHEDAHPQVRGVALFSLACCFEGTSNPRIGKMLAEIVQNEVLPIEVRESAYGGLFRLRGESGLSSPMPGKYRFPEDVNWGLVKSFLV